MPALVLKPAQRAERRAAAHHLHPVVAIGQDGATEAVRKELDGALAAHGLVKVRVFSESRAEREAMFAGLADALGAAPVQHIGKLLVFWRPPRPREKAEREDRGAGPKVVKVLKFSKSGNHRPQVKKVKVVGNMRLAAGGELKRADPKRRPSPKKKPSSSS